MSGRECSMRGRDGSVGMQCKGRVGSIPGHYWGNKMPSNSNVFLKQIVALIKAAVLIAEKEKLSFVQFAQSLAALPLLDLLRVV